MNSTHSIHALVRLLKSPTDPPSSPGPSKIEIAQLSWSDPSFCAANKGEVIGEWMLTLLQEQAKKTRRQKDTNSTSDPITDSRFWDLLASVLTTPLPTTARPIKTWLLPLLNRLQLDAVVIELLAPHSAQAVASARTALAVLWPLSEKKIGADALGECIGAVFDACTKWESMDDNLGWICSVVVNAYRNALANAGNKKKLYSSFLTTHLSSWLCAVRVNSSLVGASPTKQLQDTIYAAGTDTLFSLDALKQPLDTLFDALSSSTSLVSSLLPILPKIFTSFLAAMHRHRSALFVSAANAVDGKEEARNRSMEFVGRCWSQVWCSAALQEEFQVAKWMSVVDVFRVVHKERLFAVRSVRGIHGDVACSEQEETALKEARDKAVELLETAHTSSKELLALSMQLLDVLVQIEYSFVGSVLERVLSALINIPLPLIHLMQATSSDLLSHILEYHTKTRTVHTYVLALLGAVVADTASSIRWTHSSPSSISTFTLAHHLPALAHALHSSLAPSQTNSLAIAALHAVESAWTAYTSAGQEQERTTKRRKITKDADKSGCEATSVTVHARAFSYTCRIAGMTLSNLSVNSYTKNEEHSLEHLWDDVGKLGWSIVWDTLRENAQESGEHGTVKGGGGKKRKFVVETARFSTLFLHVVTSAALRFLYDVRSGRSSLLGDCDRLEEAHTRKLLDVAHHEGSDPELVLEIVRTLLWHNWYIHNHEPQRYIKSQPIFSVVLDILVRQPLSGPKWSGVSAGLTHENLGLAILYVLTDRWIHAFDELASTEDVKRFISLLFDASHDSPDENTRESSDEICPQQRHSVTLHRIFLDLFRNAQFWELHNIRAVFLSSALALTAPLSRCFPAAVAEVPAGMVDKSKLAVACNAYRLLCFVPSEYFSRAVRAELVKRAMATDMQICTKLEHADGQSSRVGRKGTDKGNTAVLEKTYMEESYGSLSAEESKSLSDRLMFVRVFLQRVGRIPGATNSTISVAFANHLLSTPSPISSPPNTLTVATLDLIQLHVVSLLQSQEPEAAMSFSGVVSTLMDARPFSQPDSQEAWMHTVVQSSVLRLAQHVTSDSDLASVPDQVKCALKSLFEALESALLPHAQRLIERDATELEQFLSNKQIIAWCRVLSLGRWLGINSRAASIPLGLKLATSAICTTASAKLNPETHSSILELLFEELWCIRDISHRTRLDVLVSFYAINGGDEDGGHCMDAHVSQASKRLVVEDFSYLLDILAEGIGGGGLQASQRERLIHLGKLMLHDAPQGTLKVIQGFVTRCFHLFTDQEEIYCGSTRLQMQCLEFVAKHCSDRPAAVRSVDLGSIWSLLHKILSGSSEHDVATKFPIFHHIVAIIGALIRLRRDLIVHSLPHLGLVLRQLIMLTRKIRPQLGAKQSKIVTDTFPSWLSASQPLSTDEARALARLLTSLTTKTVPRTHQSMSTESQKAESLAKPFAKHASYVLVAYVDAFNDPLCIMNAEMRRDLEPGLFALCEIVGEHSRDSLMVSALDSGGKTIMKSLWREYEKQRYVGKG